MARRLRHELGTAAARLDPALSCIRYRAEMDNGIVENEMGPVVRVLLHEPVAPNPEEVAEIRWVP